MGNVNFETFRYGKKKGYTWWYSNSLPEDFDKMKIKYLNRISDVVEKYNIPDTLIINGTLNHTV